ncbi:Uncharacterised protein [Mycobacteroides abscessus subsp. abscessus]|nr:Uncharacterised protein [Mycobacteroides abscessus subsp. abscessus]
MLGRTFPPQPHSGGATRSAPGVETVASKSLWQVSQCDLSRLP